MTINAAPLAGEDPILRGGSITVDGLTIIIPDNTMATLPATNVAWSELFDATAPFASKLPGIWKANVSRTPFLRQLSLTFPGIRKPYRHSRFRCREGCR